MTVLAAYNWRTNADLIADVAKLGYLAGDVVDVTYGRGKWWDKFRPEGLVAHDLRTVDGVDFRFLPEPPASLDTVAFDPPYKLNGTPSLDDFDDRFGVYEAKSVQERHDLIMAGISEAHRVLRLGGHLLLKCQDQVCGGQIHWQTREFADYAEYGSLFKLVDRFDMLGHHRPQPSGRRQVHAHGRPSTLLVFRKTYEPRRTAAELHPRLSRTDHP